MSVTIACDLRRKFGAVRDQSARPTCLAFALSDAHGSLHAPFKNLSVEYLYYNAVQRMPLRDPHAGVNVDSACASLKNGGQPIEDIWPYQNYLPIDLNGWTPPANCTVYTREGAVQQDDFGRICAQLDAGRPVVICMELSESFYYPIVDGTIVRRTPDPKTGNHAVIAVGHGVGESGSCLLIRNSWGTSWGLAGHAFLDEEYLASRILSTTVLS
jgi:hypothetical protein